MPLTPDTTSNLSTGEATANINCLVRSSHPAASSQRSQSIFEVWRVCDYDNCETDLLVR